MAIEATVADPNVEVFERRFRVFKGKQLTADDLSGKTAADLAALHILVDGRPVIVRVPRKLQFASDGSLAEVYGPPSAVYGEGFVGRGDQTPADKIQALDYLKEVADHSRIFIF